MKAYLINLDSRQDRLSEATKQLELFGIDFERIPAVESNGGLTSAHPFVTSSVAAIWLSHLKAITTFLDSGDDFALILEDDLEIICSSQQLAAALGASSKYDFLQLGFLVTNFIDRIDYRFANIQDRVLKILSNYSSTSLPFSSYFRSKFLVYDQYGVPSEIVKQNIRAGAHAYVVSRDFAKLLLNFNFPILFSTDQFYISLATMRSFNMARPRFALITQTNSRSSVSRRFKSQNQSGVLS